MDKVIIDNAIPKEKFDELQSLLLDFEQIPWFFQPNSSYTSEDVSLISISKERELFDFQYTHLAMSEGRFNSSLSEVLLEELYRILNNNGYSIIEVERIKLNLLTTVAKDVVHVPHVDMNVDGWTSAILYINNSDGDTHFYNEVYNESDNYKETYQQLNFDDMELVDRVQPKENRFVMFDSNQFHSSSVPTQNQYRMVVNFIFKIKESI
jgi:hypothetical protein